MTATDFSGAFDALPESGAALTAAILRHAPGDGLRILELGCGTGARLVSLAQAFGSAAVVGVDVSQENVEVARRRIAEAGLAERVGVLLVDYGTAAAGGGFDVIVAESVLHLIDHPDEALFRCLASDLADNGVVVATVPYDCASNRILWGMRRVLRRMRHPALDRLFVRVAARLHPDVPVPVLEQRVPYLYSLPRRRDSEPMRERARALAGLAVAEATPLARTSIAQPRHRLLVLAKRAP